ncbi:hypothetical protein WH47_03916, partial [Habropoda laboriosa]
QNEECVVPALAYVENNPHASVRDISKESGVSKSSVHRILKMQTLYPYRFSIEQTLRPGDEIRRMHCCWYFLTLQLPNPSKCRISDFLL